MKCNGIIAAGFCGWLGSAVYLLLYNSYLGSLIVGNGQVLCKVTQRYITGWLVITLITSAQM